jgi:hypothetical protein
MLGLDQLRKNFSFPDDMFLTVKLIQRFGTHPLSQRDMFFGGFGFHSFNRSSELYQKKPSGSGFQNFSNFSFQRIFK